MARHSPIRVVIVDHLATSRKNLCRLRLPMRDIDVVGIARTGNESLQLAKGREPHVSVLDPNFPDLDRR
jgi:chemotaxis response regulator CheB